MFCIKCGTKLPDNSKFCHNCGAPAGDTKESGFIRLHCHDCDGVMEIDEKRSIKTCPYCGSKEILIEGDKIRVARINSQARVERKRIDREIEFEKQRVHKDIEMAKIERDIKLSRKRKSLSDESIESISAAVVIIACLVFVLLMMLLGFRQIG